MVEKLKFIFSKMWDFLYPFIKIFLSAAGPILADAALKAVRIVANTNLDDDGKRKAAYQVIVDDLRDKGINIGVQVTTSMINSAIEAALQKLKAK